MNQTKGTPEHCATSKIILFSKGTLKGTCIAAGFNVYGGLKKNVLPLRPPTPVYTTASYHIVIVWRATLTTAAVSSRANRTRVRRRESWRERNELFAPMAAGFGKHGRQMRDGRRGESNQPCFLQLGTVAQIRPVRTRVINSSNCYRDWRSLALPPA